MFSRPGTPAQSVWGYALVLLCALVSLPAHGQPDVIRAIEVRGLIHAATDEVLSLVKVKPGLRLSDLGTASAIRRDIQQIMAKRFFEDVVAAFEQRSDGVTLYYVVRERPVIVDVRFEGNERVSTSTLKEVIGWERRVRREEEEAPPADLLGREKKARRRFYSERVKADYALSVENAYRERGYRNVRVRVSDEDRTPYEKVLTIQITEGDKYKIKRIEISGNEVFSKRTLRRQMRTKSRFLWLFARKYDEEKFAADMDVLRAFYGNEGYLDGRAEQGEISELSRKGLLRFRKKKGFPWFGIRWRPEKKFLILRVQVTEGSQYTALPPALRGNTLFSDAEIAGVMQTVSGEVFREARYVVEDRSRILDLYHEQGFIEARVGMDIDKDPPRKTAVPRVRLYEGERKYLGHVIIRGLEATGDEIDGRPDYTNTQLKTRRYVIRREIDLQSGDVFDLTRVREADRRLRRLRYFNQYTRTDPEFAQAQQRQLFLKPGFAEPVPTDDPEVYDLLLEAEEVRAGQVGLNVGYGTGRGAFVGLFLEEPNLYGRGQDLSLQAQLSERGTDYSISLTEPHFRQSEYSLSWTIFQRSRSRYGGLTFDEDRYGTSLRLGRRFWENTSTFAEVRWETVRIDPLDDSGYVVIDLPEVYPEERTDTTSLRVGVAHDTRDQFGLMARPGKGHLLRFSTEFAGGLGDNEFIKPDFDGTWYHGLGRRFTLALNARLATVWGYGDTDPVPIHERFFAGGPNSIRGYDFGSVGPTDVIRQMRFDNPLAGSRRDRTVFIGGETLWTNSAEVYYPFTKILDGVAFFDAGSVWVDSFDVDPGDLRFSTGVGIRVSFPVLGGPVAALDFAFPLNPMDEDDTRTVNFSIASSFR